MKLSRKKSAFYKVTFNGGPWNALEGLVPANGTMVFTLYGMQGHYDAEGTWVEAVKRRSLI